MSTDVITPLPANDSKDLAAPAPPCPDNNILNVFFHGLFCFIDRPTGMEVLLPNVPEHSYRAGPFLGETKLLGRPFNEPYRLCGVIGGCARMNRKRNLLMDEREPKPNPTSDFLHAKILLPLPKHIFDFQPVSLNLDNPQPFVSTTASLLHVFQYNFLSQSDVQLKPHTATKPGQPGTVLTAEQIGNTLYMSIHIFSEEDFEVDNQHPIEGFAAAVSLFPNLQVKLNGSDDPEPADLTKIVPGTIAAEYEDLRDRTGSRLAVLGRHMRLGDWMNSGAKAGTMTGSSPNTCTHVVSQFSQ